MGLIERMTAWMEAMPHEMLLEIAPKHQWKQFGEDPTLHPFLREYAGAIMQLYKERQATVLIPVQWTPTCVDFVALEESREDIPFAFPQLQEVCPPADQPQKTSRATYILETLSPNPQQFTISVEFLSKQEHRRRLQELIIMPST